MIHTTFKGQERETERQRERERERKREREEKTADRTHTLHHTLHRSMLVMYTQAHASSFSCSSFHSPAATREVIVLVRF